MKLTILGSGTAYPSKERNAPGFLLQISQDTVLLDAGEGIKKRVVEAGADFYKIEHIFITHFHIDHINEIPAIIWDYVARRPKGKTLYFHGPIGFQSLFKKWMNLLFPELSKTKKFPIIIKENQRPLIKINDWLVKIKPGQKQPLIRYKNYTYYRFEHKHKSFVYAGDILYNYPKELLEICQKADALLIECAMLKKHPHHLTPERVAEIAKKSGVKKLILTHFYPPIRPAEIKKRVRKIYKDPIIIARDLMEIKT